MFSPLPYSLLLLATAMLLAPAGPGIAAEAPHGAATATADSEQSADAHDAHGGGLRENLPFWSLLAFLGFLLALKFLGWDGFKSGMQAREEQTNQLIGEAEQLHRSSLESLRKQEGLMQALDERVEAALEEAERDATHTRADIQRLAEEESRVIQQRARLEIERVRNQSLHAIFAAAEERIAQGVEARIRSQLSAGVQSQLVNTAIDDFVAAK